VGTLVSDSFQIAGALDQRSKLQPGASVIVLHVIPLEVCGRAETPCYTWGRTRGERSRERRRIPDNPPDDALEFHRRTLRLRTTKDPKLSIASYGTATCAGAILGAAVTAAAFAAAPAEQPILREIAHSPDPVRLQATVQALVGFGTRHTLSDTASPRRGIGAARRWAQSRFAEIGRGCGGCLTIVTPSQTVTGERVPKPAEIVDVVAIQKGTVDPERVIVLTGHIDSRVSDPMNATADAPGADDDASGVAVVIEAARILSRHQFPATIVYGVLSGEEQGLYGGKVLADYAKAQGWRVEADLNNDIVGAIRGQNGIVDNTRLRVFSEGTRDTETAEEAKQRRFEGGENDSASRNVARYAKAVAESYMPNWTVALVYRPRPASAAAAIIRHSTRWDTLRCALPKMPKTIGISTRMCASRAVWSSATPWRTSISPISPRSPPPMRSPRRPWPRRRRRR